MDTDVVMSGSSSSFASSSSSMSPLLDFTSLHSSFPIPDRAKLMYQPLQEKEPEVRGGAKKKQKTEESEDPLKPILANLQRFIPLSFQFERVLNGEKQAVIIQILKAELTGVELGKKAYNKPETDARPVYCVYEYWLNPSIARDTQEADYQRSVAANANRSEWEKHCLAFGLRWYEEHELYEAFRGRFESLTGLDPSVDIFKASPASAADSVTAVGKFKPYWSPSPVSNGEELTAAGKVVSAAEPYHSHHRRAKKEVTPDAAAAASSSDSLEPLPSFPLPFKDAEGEDAESARHPILLRELALCAMSGSIREKPNWHNKILNPLIRFRWKCEAKSQAPELTTKALMYMMQELDYLAELKRNALASPAHVSYDLAPIDGVWQSDEAVEAELIQSILKEIKVLEDVPESEIDYHPGSDKQVIDLVHPSLFCVRYGRSRQTAAEIALKDCVASSTGIESGNVVLSPNGKAGPDAKPAKPAGRGGFGYDNRPSNYTKSDAFCWMPAEFQVDKQGKVDITSYINNLHPKKHQKLYHLLEKTFERVLPMLERVLTFITKGEGMGEESYRMKGGYEYDQSPDGDSIEERLAIAVALKEEGRALVAASKDPKFSEKEPSSSDEQQQNDEPAITYLKTFHPSPVQALQRDNTERVMGQIHPGLKISGSAMTWLTSSQDALAHIILQECLGPTAPKNASAFEEERSKRLAKREAALKAEAERVAAEAAKKAEAKKAAAAEKKAAASADGAAEEEKKDGDEDEDEDEDENDPMEDGEDDGEGEGDDEEMDEDAEHMEDEEEEEEDENAAALAAAAEGGAALNVDYSFLEGLEPFFHPSVDAAMGELVKHSYSEATKAVKKAKAGNSPGLVFRNSLAKRWYDDFKASLSSAAAAALKPSLTLVQQVSLCAMIEYLTAEYLELAGNAARDFRTDTVEVKFLKMAADFDVELKPLTDGIFKALNTRNAQELFQQAQALHAAAEENKQKALGPTLGGDPLVPALSKKEIAAQKKKEKEARKLALKAEDAADKVAQGAADGASASASASNDSASAEDEKAIAEAVAQDDADGEEDDDDGDEDDEDSDMDDYYSRRGIQLGDVSFPYARPPPFESLPASSRVDLKGRRLQVIVKLANIVLTPDNPNYSGGSWHVEGMENESIVASSIVYLHSENITESLLRFRHSCSFVHPEQDDSYGPTTAWGLSRDEALNQVLGSVITQAGRAIAFPNVFQHQVQSFRLIDKSKPGFRKILVFFLVDPNKRIPSSSTIPPQNQQWVDEYFKEQVNPLLLETPLIPDLANIVKEYAVGRFETEEEKAKSHFTDMAGAKKDRTQLMKERKFFVEQNSQIVFEREYAFCEH